MLFHDSKDESAWGLALVGLLVVTMAAFLGEMTGRVQPTAPYEMSHPDTSSPGLQEHVRPPNGNQEATPYTQPQLHEK